MSKNSDHKAGMCNLKLAGKGCLIRGCLLILGVP